jgi:histidine triad (HIT) family protein
MMAESSEAIEMGHTVERSMDCLFCRIVHGEMAAAVVYEDDRHLVIMDHRPVQPGHCLVLPKRHIQTLHDLGDAADSAFFRLIKQTSQAVEKALSAEGTLVAINTGVDQSVPHLHAHVIPRRRRDRLVFRILFRRKRAPDGLHDRIRQALLDQ